MTEYRNRIIGFLKDHPVLVAGTMGLDKKPQLHRVELCYEEEGAFYFAAAKCESYYGEISLYPFLTLCAYDPEEGVFLRLKGRAVFSEEEGVIMRCLTESPALSRRWGSEPGMLIAYFLKDMTAEFLYDDGTREEISLGTPENALVGITIKKDKELRDRLSRIMEQRETEKPEPGDEENLHRQKIFDGMLLVFAEKAKELWPRLDVQPAERSALFETYDEREEYMRLARKRLGNARIEKPEDFTYWLSPSE